MNDQYKQVDTATVGPVDPPPDRWEMVKFAAAHPVAVLLLAVCVLSGVGSTLYWYYGYERARQSDERDLVERDIALKTVSAQQTAHNVVNAPAWCVCDNSTPDGSNQSNATLGLVISQSLESCAAPMAAVELSIGVSHPYRTMLAALKKGQCGVKFTQVQAPPDASGLQLFNPATYLGPSPLPASPARAQKLPTFDVELPTTSLASVEADVIGEVVLGEGQGEVEAEAAAGGE